MRLEDIKSVLSSHYGLKDIIIDQLEGYISTNYKISTGSLTYILKIYPYSEDTLADIHAENKILSQLQDISLDIPKPVAAVSGETLVEDQTQKVFYRLITFVNGDLWAENDHTTLDINTLGEQIGELDNALEGVSAPIIKGRNIPWDLANFLDNTTYINHIREPQRRALVSYFTIQWKTEIIPQLSTLRKAYIHNDANDYNILCLGSKPTGLIDFGDMVYSYVLNELAVASTYLAIDNEDPIQVISEFIKGYNRSKKIEKHEVDLLYYFIAGRLCTSVLQSALAAKDQPENSYAQVSNRGAWDLLSKWITINPIRAKNQWRKTLGYPAVSFDKHLRKRRERYMPTAYSLSYTAPIHMTKAAFQYMYDAEGNAILDAYNNIIQVGHCHPRVVEAGQQAMARLNTNTRYLYDNHATYCERLLSYFPDHIDQVFLVNSGSAAADLAIRLARTYTGRKATAVVRHGYHGNTSTTIDVSHYKYGNKGGLGRSEDVLELDLPDAYRGRYQDEAAGLSYASDAIHLIQEHGAIGAFIAEPIVGCGGQVPLAEGYLAEIYRTIRSLGGVCISDEVQTGFGRTGNGFWGYQLHGVVPDIIIMGKPIGNGHPMGAVATTREIADSFDNGMEYFSSFGGNPVSCAIGHAVLDVIEEEQLMDHAAKTGQYLKTLMKELMNEHEEIGDVRGSGLFLGFDMVTNHDMKEPNPQLAKKIINQLREKNILTSVDGPHHNVIKVKPPLCFNKENSDFLAESISNVIK